MEQKANASVEQKSYIYIYIYLLLSYRAQSKMAVLWLYIGDKMVNIYIYIYILLKYIIFYCVGGGGCCLL